MDDEDAAASPVGIIGAMPPRGARLKRTITAFQNPLRKQGAGML